MPAHSVEPAVCVADDGLYCFDSTHLAPRWQARRNLSTHPPVRAGELIVASGHDGISAYDGHGRRVWQAPTGATFAPRLDGDSLYAGTRDGQVLRLDASSGQIVWRTRLTGWVYAPALLRRLAVTGGQAGVLVALDRDSGALVWRRELPQELVYAPLELGPDRLVVTTFDGRVTVLNGRGVTVWERRFEVASQTPVMLGERLYCALFDGRLIALRLADGATDWQARFETMVSARAAAGALLVYNDDAVVAFAASGERLWQRRFASRVVGLHALPGQRMAVFVRDAGSPPRALSLAWPAPQPVAGQ